MLRNMERLETILVPGILGPKLAPTLKSLLHLHLAHKAHPIINMGQGRQHWGHKSNIPIGPPTPPSAWGALRIQDLLYFTYRCANSPLYCRVIKPIAGKYPSRSWVLRAQRLRPPVVRDQVVLHVQSITTDTLKVILVMYSMVTIVNNAVLYI